MIDLDVLFLCHCLIMLWYQPKTCFNFAQNFFKYKCLLFSNRLQVLMYLCMLHCSMYYYCCHVALPMTVSQCTVAVVAAVVVAAAWVWYGMEIENVKLCVDWLTGQRGLAAWDCDWGMILGASCASHQVAYSPPKAILDENFLISIWFSRVRRRTISQQRASWAVSVLLLPTLN